VVDTLAVIDKSLATVSTGPLENIDMSQRRTTVPPTRAHQRSSPSDRSELTAKEKTKKQSAKRTTAL